MADNIRTAVLILGLHREYVRYLIRRGQIPATKENGEFRVALGDAVDFAIRGMRSAMGGGDVQYGRISRWLTRAEWITLQRGQSAQQSDSEKETTQD